MNPLTPGQCWCPFCHRIVACDNTGKLYNHYLKADGNEICPGTGMRW